MARFFDNLLEKCAGRGAADKLHTALLEKEYLKALTQREAELHGYESTGSLSSSLKEQAHEMALQDTIEVVATRRKPFERTSSTFIRPDCNMLLPPRPMLGQRSQSEIILSEKPSDEDCLPPDLSCTVKSNSQPTSPRNGASNSNEVIGLGRYHRSANATTEWVNEHVRKQLGCLAPYVGDDLDIAEIPKDQFQHIRRSSELSAYSSSSSLYSEEVDPVTGCLVIRGFVSGGNSARSSFSHRRTDSGLSLASIKENGDGLESSSRPTSQPTSRKSSLRPEPGFAIAPLTPINENFPRFPVRRKIVPLDFPTSGCDEAIDSDDGDDAYEDVDDSKPQMAVLPPLNPKPNGHVQFAPQVIDRQPTRGNLDRSKTVKRSSAPSTRRTNSRSGRGGQQPQLRRPSSEKSVTKNDNTTNAHVIDDKDTNIEQTTNANGKEGKQDPDDTSSIASTETITEDDAVITCEKTPLTPRRKRAETAIRLPPPNLRVEGTGAPAALATPPATPADSPSSATATDTAAKGKKSEGVKAKVSTETVKAAKSQQKSVKGKASTSKTNDSSAKLQPSLFGIGPSPETDDGEDNVKASPEKGRASKAAAIPVRKRRW